MRSIIVLSLALLLVACKHEKEYSGNPIVEGWYADPEGVVFDDEYWIYPTLSDIPFGADSTDFPELKKETRAIHQVYNIQTYMDAFSSKDMVHWTKHPKVLSVENIKWNLPYGLRLLFGRMANIICFSGGMISRMMSNMVESVSLWLITRQAHLKTFWGNL